MLLSLYQIFIFLLDHLHFFLPFFITFMENLFKKHPILNAFSYGPHCNTSLDLLNLCSGDFHDCKEKAMTLLRLSFQSLSFFGPVLFCNVSQHLNKMLEARGVFTCVRGKRMVVGKDANDEKERHHVSPNRR